HRGPAGLMRGAAAASGIAVEEFVERHMIAKSRVLLLDRRVAKDWTATRLVAHEDPREAPAQLGRHLAQMHEFARSDRALHLEVVAIVAVKPPQRLDDQRVDRKPDRPAPI